MSRIWVCGLGEMPDMVERVRPARLISLLPADEQPPTPTAMRATDHLRVLVDDIDGPLPGHTAPERNHVQQIVRFVRAAPPTASLVIHCLAGVSRSTAAALVTLVLDVPGREREAASALRRAAPFADPNRRIIALADAELGRNGALVAAVAGMGDPDWADGIASFHVARRVPIVAGAS